MKMKTRLANLGSSQRDSHFRGCFTDEKELKQRLKAVLFFESD